jgi:S1-C subfamily serine protease
MVVADESNDLALLRSKRDHAGQLPIAEGSELEQGQDVYVFGYPLDGYLPASGNITPGMISALAGPSNNSSLIQVTAPVQQGNSGGPVINKKGRVVGIVVGKADAIRIAKATGDIPQNINFAISVKTVRAFLDGNGVPYESGRPIWDSNKDAVRIAELAREQTVKLECWR